MLTFARKVFGSANDRKVRLLQPRVVKINALEPEFEALTDEELRAKTVELREAVANGATLDSVLEPAFAAVREAAKRALGMRHFDVQLVGGMILHDGDIAEMKTGEGKTLVATLPVYLNALTGRGVHVVTVNDYLAKRDSEWMGKIYRFLGLTVGVIVHGLDDPQRQRAYACDVTYGTNNEFGFDYLRDNMKYALDEMCQRGHAYAIVDEVDSILIDESRTPLIISGPTDDRSDFYKTIDALIPELSEDDYEIDEKQRSVAFTESGNERLEGILTERELLEGEGGLYDIANVSVVHHVNQALKAHALFLRDRDYILKNDQVILIDEFTGRMMEGRRLSEGLHQAIEAKEGVQIQPENVTLASITFQNYFRLYDKLAGMTGTAATEESEFQDIYGLRVYEVPTNRPIARQDDDDEVYRTTQEKLDALVAELADAHLRGQPVLVGTVSIEKSEKLAALLSDRAYVKQLGEKVKTQAATIDDPKRAEDRDAFMQLGQSIIDLAANAKGKAAPIPHLVLNARYHEQEALIVADAGVPGAITIATNMAGRGTDIQLGGNVDMRLERWMAEETDAGREPSEADIQKQTAKIEADVQANREVALKAGGLYVIGSERHESRRIDNQLRGRTGRQGDPGRSRFFISLEDDLLRIFAPERLDGIMRTLGMREGEAIVHPWMNKALETSQRKVEQRNFEIRKNLLKYDDVTNDQRKAIFEQRIEFMSEEDVGEVIGDMRRELVEDMVARHMPAKAYAEQWDIDALVSDVDTVFGMQPPVRDWASEEGIADEEMRERLQASVDEAYADKSARVSPDIMRRIEKQILLQTIDLHWREHLQQLDHLRSVIHLRGYAQRDPLNEFKTEAFTLFERLLSDLRADVVRVLSNLRVQVQEQAPVEVPPNPELPKGMVAQHVDPATGRRIPVGPPPEPADQGLGAAARAPRLSSDQRDPANPATWGRIGRNEACPCGSGKKYKHCHGSVTASA